MEKANRECSKKHIIDEACLFVCIDCLCLCCNECASSHESLGHELLNVCSDAPRIIDKVQKKVPQLDYLHMEASNQCKEVEDVLLQVEELVKYNENKIQKIQAYKQQVDNINGSSLGIMEQLRSIQSTLLAELSKPIISEDLICDLQLKYMDLNAQLEQLTDNYKKIAQTAEVHEEPKPKVSPELEEAISKEKIRKEKLKKDIVQLKTEMKNLQGNLEVKKPPPVPIEEKKEAANPSNPIPSNVFVPYPKLKEIITLERMHSKIKRYNIPLKRSHTCEVKNMAIPYCCDFCITEDGSIFISGGMYDLKVNLNTLYKIEYYPDHTVADSSKEIVHLELKASMAYSRQNHTLVAVNNNLLCTIGGRHKLVDRTTEFYNVEKDTWENGGNLRCPREQSAGCPVNKRYVYVFGGAVNDNIFSQYLIEYCDTAGKWDWNYFTVENPDFLLELLGKTLAGAMQISLDEILVFGGCKSKGVPTASTMIIDLKKREVIKCKDLPIATEIKDSKPVWYKTTFGMMAKHPSPWEGDKVIFKKCNLVYSAITRKWHYSQ